jgi:hypothetical protein
MEEYNDDYATCHKTYATLMIIHPELDPDTVTQNLGIQPTRTYRRGEVRNPQGRCPFVYQRGGWFLESEGAVQSRDARRHIDWLLDRVEPHREALNRWQVAGYQTVINCYWDSAYGQGGPMLGPVLMGRVSNLGLELWFDIFLHYYDEEAEGRK